MLSQVTLLAFAALAVAVPAPEEAGTLSLPVRSERLGPRADGTVDMAAVLKHISGTLRKYNAGHDIDLKHYGLDESDDESLEERATSNVPLTDQAADLLYFGLTKVGKAKQAFTTDFDTGSADYFVPGPNCTGCHGTPYDQTGTNRKTTTSVTYGSGSVSGNDYYDTVCVGGLCAPKTNLISLTNAQGFSASKSSSLMGMGFSAIAASKQPTFFENLIKLGKVTKPEFSFFLGRKKSKTGGKSVLTLGGVDTSRFTGKATSHKVVKKGYWQLAIAGASVSGGLLDGLVQPILAKGQGAIDTGTTVIIAPVASAVGINTALGGVLIPLVATGSATEQAFAYDCGTKSVVSLIFGKKKYAINPLDLNLGKITPAVANKFNLPTGSIGLCFSSIIGAQLQTQSGAIYVVGDSFLKNWYSTYSYANPASVSFAKSI